MNERKIIDVHAHIVPEVDDGARSIKESCRLLSLAAGQGIREVIATPHSFRGKRVEELKAVTEQIQKEMRYLYPDFTLHLGQENFYREELPARLREGKALTMTDSRYVLVEFDPEVTYDALYRGIHTLSSIGYLPVLAHVERYRCMRREERMEELTDKGCFLQMNYKSLQGRWYNKNVRWCRRQVTEGRIHLLGTDMHRTDFRPPVITEALGWLESHVDGEQLDAMTRKNPLKLICYKNKDEVHQEK